MSSRILSAALLCALCGLCRGEPTHPDIPEPALFKPFLVRDLTAYFTRQYGKGVEADYELLRDGPTITGIAYPKYYLWVTVTQDGTTRVDGAARVAAIQKRFEVTDFIFRSVIQKRPELLESTYPKALLPVIRAKAASEQ